MAGPAGQSFVGTRVMDGHQLVAIDGVPVIESFPKLFEIVCARCGPNVGALFPEPRISRGDGGAPTKIDWYARYEGVVRPLNQLDASSALAVQRTLQRRLAALRPLASDPECGPLVTAALNIAAPESIISVGGDPVLVDWGMLPLAILPDKQARARHFNATLGPFIGDWPLPPLSRAEWGVRFGGSSSPASSLDPAGEAAGDGSSAPPAPAAVSPTRAPILLVSLIGGASAAIALGLLLIGRAPAPLPAEEASKEVPAQLALKEVPAQQALKDDDIVCALNPTCAKPIASSTSQGDVEIARRAQPALLSIDLYVNFAYGSTELTTEARATLDRLGRALRDQRLDGFSFMIAGHTDAKGGAEYNLSLSERRAEAVRQYMITQYGISPERLSAKGYGKSRPLDPAHPEDGVNRRVQVVNTTASGERQ